MTAVSKEPTEMHWRDAPFVYVQRADDAFDVIATTTYFPEYVCTARTREWAADIATALEADANGLV